jgi:hypothetical protein
MSEYMLQFFADPNGPTGHFSVRVVMPGGPTAAFGKYPKGEKLDAIEGPGEIRDDSERVDAPRMNGEKDVFRREVSLTEDQAEKVQNYLIKAKNSPSDYNLKHDNCIDFAQGDLDAAGVEKRLADLFSDKELEAMGSLGPFGLGAGDEAQRDRDAHRIKILSDSVADAPTLEPDNPFARIVAAQRAEDRAAGRPTEKDEAADGAADGAANGAGIGNALKAPPPAANDDTADEPPSPSMSVSTAETEGFAARESRDAGPVKSPSDAARALVARVEADRFDSDDDLLLKRPEQITEGERDRLWAASVKHPDGHPLNRAFADARTKAFEHVFGTDPAGVDAAGRVHRPDPLAAPPAAPEPPKDAKGRDVKDAVLRTARHIVATAGDDVPGAVKALQAGLNVVERARRFGRQDADESDAPFEPLKTDGVFGPKTHGALKRTVAKAGAPKAREALALGRFRTLAETAKRNPDQAARLRPAVEREIGDLFPARPRADAAGAPVRALQARRIDTAQSARIPSTNSRIRTGFKVFF